MTWEHNWTLLKLLFLKLECLIIMFVITVITFQVYPLCLCPSPPSSQLKLSELGLPVSDSHSLALVYVYHLPRYVVTNMYV